MDKLAEQFGVNLDFFAVFITWGLIFTRTFVMLTLTPFIGGKGIPGRIRFLTAAVLTSYVFYFLNYNLENQVPEDKGLIFALFFKEIFFGLTIGLTAIMCFYAIEAGGRIVDNQRGSANAQIFLPALGQVSIFGLFQYWLGVSLFCAISGHLVFLQGFMDSFRTVSVFTLPKIEPGLSPFLALIIRMSSDVLIMGMQLAAPVLITIFLTDLVLGIANKMAPQIPVFELGFILKGYVGVAMVFVSVHILVRQMGTFFNVMHNNLEYVVRYFGG